MKFYVKEMLANECHRHSFYGEFFLDEINFAIIIVSLHTHADTISLTLKWKQDEMFGFQNFGAIEEIFLGEDVTLLSPRNR